MSKKCVFIPVGAAILLAIGVSGAYLYDYAKAVTGVLHVHMDDDTLGHTLGNLCPMQSTVAQIEEYLGTAGIEHSYDPGARRMQACVRDRRRLTWGLVTEVVLITVQFDSSERASDVSFKRAHTGS